MVKSQKVVVLGARGVGKTAILKQVLYGNVSPYTEFSHTIEDIYSMQIPVERGGKERVKFYDTAGYDPINFIPDVSQHVAYADGYILVYATNWKDSFSIIESLKREIERTKEKKEVHILVIGSKADLTGEREVDSGYAESWSVKERTALYEVCTWDKQQLRDGVSQFAAKLHPPPSKPTLAALTIGRKSKTASDS